MTRTLLIQALELLIERGAQPGYKTERAWLKTVKEIEAHLAPPLYTTRPQHTEAEVQEILAADWNLSQDKMENTVRRILGVPAP